MAIGHVYHEINHDGTTENLLSDEERFLGTRRSTNPKNSRIGFLRALLRQYWCILDSAGIVTIIALSVALITRHAPDSDAIGGDVTGFSPSFSQHIHTFSPEPEYFPHDAIDWFTEKNHQAWLAMIPQGGGVVKIADTSKYSPLPTPLADKAFIRLNETAFITSIGHQFHCLRTISDAFYRLASIPVREVSEQVMLHVPHCFAYLRQAIQCNGDMALEGSDPRFTDSPLGSNQGWDGLHVCKDYTQIKKHLESRKALIGIEVE